MPEQFGRRFPEAALGTDCHRIGEVLTGPPPQLLGAVLTVGRLFSFRTNGPFSYRVWHSDLYQRKWRQNGARMTIRINDTTTIEDWELTEQFVRASGPGGQNVNKVASAVELRFEAERSPNLPDPVKRRLRRLAGRRWTKEGAVVIQCDETRHQARNREIAR